VNLGQGFPNWDPPPFVVKSMEETVNVKGPSTNQYCRPQCHLPLGTRERGRRAERRVERRAKLRAGAKRQQHTAQHYIKERNDEI